MKRIVTGVAVGLVVLALSTPAYALKGQRASGHGTTTSPSVTFSFSARGTGTSGDSAVGSFKLTDTTLFGGTVSGDINCLYAYTLGDGTESNAFMEGTITKATDSTKIGQYVQMVGSEFGSGGSKGGGFWTEAPTVESLGCSFSIPGNTTWGVTGRVSVTS